jgi:hypothetical protein
MARTANSPSPNVDLRLDREDKALLNALILHEKLTRSDVLRRAIRQYAKTLGVTPSPKAI